MRNVYRFRKDQKIINRMNKKKSSELKFKVRLGSSDTYTLKNRHLKTIEKEDLYNENIHLKMTLNSVQEELLKQKTRNLYLERELKAFQDRKTTESGQIKVTSALITLKETVKNLNLKVSRLKKELAYIRNKIPEEGRNEAPSKQLTRFLTQKLSSINEHKRILNRQLAAKPVAILDTFFRKLLVLIKEKGESIEEFANNLCQTSEIDELVDKLEQMGYRIPYNEVEAVFNILKIDESVSVTDIVKQLRNIEEQLDSDRSSDISSPKTKTSHSSYELGSFHPEELQENIDFFAMILRSVSKEQFKETLNNLPENVKYEDINKLFLEKSHRIEEGADRNKLIRYFLNDNHYLPREVITQRMLTDFYWYEQESEGSEKEKIDIILHHNRDLILKKCQEADYDKRGSISWKYFAPIIQELEDLTRALLFELQCKCYSYHKSLYFIDYEEILKDVKCN